MRGVYCVTVQGEFVPPALRELAYMDGDIKVFPSIDKAIGSASKAKGLGPRDRKCRSVLTMCLLRQPAGLRT
jgi:hypothetical protein